MVLASQEYWQSLWKGQPTRHGFRYLTDVAPYLPAITGLDFFEIGCAPGGILADFSARFGYVAHGIDYASDPSDIESYIRGLGLSVGEIYQGDFLKWQPRRRYDIVASFGFIEHFDDPNPVVDKHFQMVRPGGTVVITMPNYARGQKLLHWLFDRESLRRHNTTCMNLGFLRAAAVRNAARTVALRYAGGHFDFWYDHQQRSRLTWMLMGRTVGLLQRITGALPVGVNPWSSPYIIGIFRIDESIN